MATISITEAKAMLDTLVRDVAVSGERYIIAVNGQPMAELRPFVPVPTPGRFKETIRFTDDAFAALANRDAEAWGV